MAKSTKTIMAHHRLDHAGGNLLQDKNPTTRAANAKA